MKSEIVLTPFPFPQVVSRTDASFRVLKFSVSAGQLDFCDGFDSRQLHNLMQVRTGNPDLPLLLCTPHSALTVAEAGSVHVRPAENFVYPNATSAVATSSISPIV